MTRIDWNYVTKPLEYPLPEPYSAQNPLLPGLNSFQLSESMILTDLRPRPSYVLHYLPNYCFVQVVVFKFSLQASEESLCTSPTNMSGRQCKSMENIFTSVPVTHREHNKQDVEHTDSEFMHFFSSCLIELSHFGS